LPYVPSQRASAPPPEPIPSEAGILQ
jgi:hypothetical protein